MEIERKFTIKALPENLLEYEKKEIEQGYLCSNPTVRIRKSNHNYMITYKSKKNKKSSAIVNEEVELPLTKEAYLHLREKVDGHLITKTRYLIPLEDGLVIELDVFKGYLEGLCFAEVEFPSEEVADSFVPPNWFLDDVSKDKRYRNHYLSTIDFHQ